MKTVISLFFFDWSDVDECFRRAKNDLGLDGVELSFHPTFARDHCTHEDIAAVREARETHGVLVTSHLWENLPGMEPTAAAESLLRWIPICRDGGIDQLVIHGGSYPDRSEGVVRTRRVLEKVLPEYERQGIVINLENHYGYDYRNCQEIFYEPWEFLELFAAIDSPSLRFCLDTGHAQMNRNFDEMLGALAAYLHYVHIADNYGTDDDHVMYKTGVVPFDRVLPAFRATGYDGIICYEFPAKEDTGPLFQCNRDLKALWGA
ncbi:MAG TPA: sugar phosphate isomerase/epimerase family protein [Phycisphaerae bacterium]|nr:sugar phosphate isomerase/epimerase family protein [Phycisphaerae bacterium]